MSSDAAEKAAIATVYAVFADGDEAERIGRAMVERGHAACVNILAPCSSIYRWQGRVEQAEEVPALFKVLAAGVPRLIAEIAALHSYETPAIVAWPIAQSHDDYRQWLSGNMIPVA